MTLPLSLGAASVKALRVTHSTPWDKAQALGLTNMRKDLAGHRRRAEQTGSQDMGEYVRERWYLWTEPDVPLPLWVLIPKGEPAERPLVLTPHGHNHPDVYVGITRNADEEKHLKEGQRAIAVQSVMQGYLTIAPTTRAFGETAREKELAEGKNVGILFPHSPQGRR